MERRRRGCFNKPNIKLSPRAKTLSMLLTMLACIGALAAQCGIYGADPVSGALSMQLPFILGQTQASPPPEANGESEADRLDIEITDIDESVGDQMRIEIMRSDAPSSVDLSGSEPRILIYHTHTTEAYRQDGSYTYEQSSSWRTKEVDKNIVAVGEKLTRLLREEYGINVIHDATDHEPPKLSTSYSRSVITMEKYKKEYPSITMFIDVHRDAYGKSESGKSDYVTIDGRQCARMMFVVGTGEGATGSGFDEMPDFQSNYALAKCLTERLCEVDSALMRNIRVKTGRYNQHISNQCLLVEVGHNMNTLEQALNSVEHLAEAIAFAAGLSSGGPAVPESVPAMLELVP